MALTLLMSRLATGLSHQWFAETGTGHISTYLARLPLLCPLSLISLLEITGHGIMVTSATYYGALPAIHVISTLLGGSLGCLILLVLFDFSLRPNGNCLATVCHALAASQCVQKATKWLSIQMESLSNSQGTAQPAARNFAKKVRRNRANERWWARHCRRSFLLKAQRTALVAWDQSLGWLATFHSDC